MKLAIAVLELKHLPDNWTKEDVASYIDGKLSAMPRKPEIRASIAAAKVFEVKEE